MSEWPVAFGGINGYKRVVRRSMSRWAVAEPGAFERVTQRWVVRSHATPTATLKRNNGFQVPAGERHSRI
jgi:hypothetical protein